jgi:hypothetical protein
MPRTPDAHIRPSDFLSVCHWPDSNTGQPSNREIDCNDGKHRHRARKHYARRDLPTAQINQFARPYLGTIFCLPNYEAMRLPIARRTGCPVVETAPESFPALGLFYFVLSRQPQIVPFHRHPQLRFCRLFCPKADRRLKLPGLNFAQKSAF